MKTRACEINNIVTGIGVAVVKGFLDTGNSFLGREKGTTAICKRKFSTSRKLGP